MKKTRSVLKLLPISLIRYCDLSMPWPNNIFFEFPTLEDKKNILNYVPDPDFENHYYIRLELLPKEIDGNKIPYTLGSTPHKFLKVKKSDTEAVLVDKENREVIGTWNKPYKLYTPPDRHRLSFGDGEVIPYVCYHQNGEIIKEAIQYCLNELPENTSEESYISVFQWKNENPSREGYYVTPKRIRVSAIAGMLNRNTKPG